MMRAIGAGLCLMVLSAAPLAHADQVAPKTKPEAKPVLLSPPKITQSGVEKDWRMPSGRAVRTIASSNGNITVSTPTYTIRNNNVPASAHWNSDPAREVWNHKTGRIGQVRFESKPRLQYVGARDKMGNFEASYVDAKGKQHRLEVAASGKVTEVTK